MRIFIIGGIEDKDKVNDEFLGFCRAIGENLATKNIEILVCSPFPDAADFYIVDGIKRCPEKKGSLEIYYPASVSIEKKWDETLDGLERQIKVSKFRQESPLVNEPDQTKYSWLFCQIKAIITCDFVIVIGGRITGSSNLLVRIAEAQGKEIIPLPGFKGVGEMFFERKRFQLIDYWTLEHVEIFEASKEPKRIVDIIIDQPKDRRAEKIKEKKQSFTFFISYSQERPSEADFVEMILRRRNHNVLRDDNNFSASEDIPNAIKENIHKSDVFIALWCKEYACSPWCYDELELALDTYVKGKALWIFRTDKTRIVHPRARNIVYYDTSTRAEIEAKILSLIEKI